MRYFLLFLLFTLSLALTSEFEEDKRIKLVSTIDGFESYLWKSKARRSTLLNALMDSDPGEDSFNFPFSGQLLEWVKY